VDELIIYKNELKNFKPARYKVIGIVSKMLLSRELFNKNEEIIDFLKYVMETEFKEYVIASRTLIVARTVRIIEGFSDKEYLDCKKKLYKYIDSKIVNPNKKNIFDGWL
jgi:DNA-binding phage protein